MERKGITFEEWFANLAKLPAGKLICREDFAFCETNLIPSYLESEFEEFCRKWRERFGRKTTLREITKPGWYNLTVRACEGVYTTYPPKLQTSLNVWAPGTLERIRENWEKTFPGKGEEALVLAHIRIDDSFGPWITELTSPPTSRKWGVVHYYSGMGRWALKEYEGNFSIRLPGPGHCSFQRALRLIERTHSTSGWYEEGAIMLEWVFAAGDADVLSAVDDALSGRRNQTLASARQLVRAARA